MISKVVIHDWKVDRVDSSLGQEGDFWVSWTFGLSPESRAFRMDYELLDENFKVKS